MRVSGSPSRGGDSSVRQANLVFSRMERYASRLGNTPKAEDVHRFRTNSRRVEALVEALVSESGNKKKLLKMLAKGRKKAGKLRDLDVEIAFLKDLKVPDHYDHRLQLLEQLQTEHTRRAKKLTKFFDSQRVAQLRKRLRKAKSEVKLDGIDALKLACEQLPQVESVPLNEKMLHACRIAAKRVRYLAELAVDSAEAKIVVAELKNAQDEIGQWHDALKLTERAEKMFAGARPSPVLSALKNITHARFRRAAGALQMALKNVSGLRATPAPVAKPSQPATTAQIAAA